MLGLTASCTTTNISKVHIVGGGVGVGMGMGVGAGVGANLHEI